MIRMVEQTRTYRAHERPEEWERILELTNNKEEWTEEEEKELEQLGRLFGKDEKFVRYQGSKQMADLVEELRTSYNLSKTQFNKELDVYGGAIRRIESMQLIVSDAIMDALIEFAPEYKERLLITPRKQPIDPTSGKVKRSSKRKSSKIEVNHDYIKLIKKIRNEQGLSMKQTAEKMGVSKSSIGKWESGKQGIARDQLEKYKNAFQKYTKEIEEALNN